MDKTSLVEITDISVNTARHKTFTLDVGLEAVPGQFLMLWIPGIDEKPMSLSSLDPVKVTVKKAGRFTELLFDMEPGDEIGVRGPYGNGFKPVAGECLLVGGGCGMAPLMPLAKNLQGEAVVSALTKDELLFADELRGAGVTVHTATDDGSQGHPGLAHELVAEILSEKTFDCIFACGPEPMMKKVADQAVENEIPCQLSLERYMKCGIGLCASCMIGDKRVCVEGPVFLAKELESTEFGVFKRDECACMRRMNDE